MSDLSERGKNGTSVFAGRKFFYRSAEMLTEGAGKKSTADVIRVAKMER